MMGQGRKPTRLLVALTLALVVAGCTASGSQPSTAGAPAAGAPPAKETLRVAWAPSLTIAPMYVALDRGYWQEQGIEFRLEQVQSAADSIAFLANGQLDASFGAIAVALYNAVNQGLNVRVIAPASYERSDRATAVLVRKELWDSGAVRSVADLRGRRVYTVAPGSGAAYVRIKALEKAGLRDQDIELVSLALPDAPAAMSNAAIDAGNFPEPWSTRMLLEGLAVVLDPAPAPGTLVTTIMAGEHLRRDRVDVGRRFMLGYLKGVRDLQTREQILSDDTVEILARWLGLSPELIRQLQSIPRWDPNLHIDVENLMDQQRVHIAARAASYTEPLPVDRLVDTSLADYAVQQLGRYPQ